YGQLDVIFCNDKITNKPEQRILDFDLDMYDKLFAINVRGMSASKKHATRSMLKTSLLHYLLEMGMGTEELDRVLERSSCLKGILKVNHVADAVVFLASHESEFITGHNLAVDSVYKE
ncbi:hypothetical protein CFOL_v3_31177, partial [Cephalotus follicularis]